MRNISTDNICRGNESSSRFTRQCALIVFSLFLLGGIKKESTYTEIGCHSLSPHVGGFLWVTHHLQGVHLNTSIHSEQVKPGAED